MVIMPEEDHEEKKDVFELMQDEYFLRKKLWDDFALTKEEREDLIKKQIEMTKEIRERRGEVQEMFKKERNRTVEERQQTIDNAEMILSNVSGLSPEMIETSNEIVDIMKRNLEKRKNQVVCPTCGKFCSLQARFCNRCGNKIE